ncbi:gluconate 2-dehydrogenase subunit 3 family protein [Pseudomonas shirazensis]
MNYGKDPNLRTPKRTWKLILTEPQRILIEHLSDFILQMPVGYLKPSEINISHFFDEWLGAPYHEQQGDRPLLLKGLELIDHESLTQFGVSFCKLIDKQKKVIIDGMISSSNTSEQGLDFFKRFRYLLLGGYYTSNFGFKAIGYIGNIPLSNFPEPSTEAKLMIKAELERLGLPSDI